MYDSLSLFFFRSFFERNILAFDFHVMKSPPQVNIAYQFSNWNSNYFIRCIKTLRFKSLSISKLHKPHLLCTTRLRCKAFLFRNSLKILFSMHLQHLESVSKYVNKHIRVEFFSTWARFMRHTYITNTGMDRISSKMRWYSFCSWQGRGEEVKKKASKFYRKVCCADSADLFTPFKFNNLI